VADTKVIGGVVGFRCYMNCNNGIL